MAVTIEKRPIGVILDTCVTATINQDYNSVYATVNKTSHGLSDGDYVYIQSNVENYNGFWVIEVTNANEFLLVDNPYVEWIVDADITYCPQYTTHGWQCVHLPIVYELSNTRWPTNSVDTARTISSISDDNGYLNLNLSGSLGTFEDLAFVKISNAPDSDFDGVYQVIDKLATNDVTVNLTYSSVTASGLVGATIQLYYQSYNIVVRVYAGLNSSHYWADQKPYELAATLELIPDTDNKVKFSINEILKGYIETKNNLLLPTLPNNLDAWCQFYIEVGEQYDTSDGYTVSTFEGGFASDQSEFEGYAVNAMLPFKNIYSGHLSEYLLNGTDMNAKFLTLFTTGVLFSCYQDISFIYDDTDFYDITETKTASEAGYANSALGIAYADWALTLNRATVAPATSNSEVAYKKNHLIEGVRYRFEWDVDGTGTYTGGGGNALSVVLGFYDGSYTFLAGVSMLSATGSSKSSVSSDYVTVPANTVYFGIQVTSAGLVSGSYQVDINSLVIKSNSVFVREKKYLNGTLLATSNNQIAYGGPGVYRYPLTYDPAYDQIIISVHNDDGDTGQLSESFTFEVNSECSNQSVCLSWMNYLGAMEPTWEFTGETEHTVDITNSGETKANIFPTWPKSYGEHADTIRKQTFRESANKKFIFSQYLTQDEADAIAFIKSSPLVQIVNSRQDRRTVLVDTDSFTKYKDGDKTYSISFNILYTDDIPSQRV